MIARLPQALSIAAAGALLSACSLTVEVSEYLGPGGPEPTPPGQPIGWLVVSGGRVDRPVSDDEEPTTSVVIAAIQPDGTLGAWKDASPLPLPLAYHGSAARGGRLFVFGDAFNYVESAAFSATFDAASSSLVWSASKLLGPPIFDICIGGWCPSYAATDSAMYLTGGGNYTDTEGNLAFAEVWTAPLDELGPQAGDVTLDPSSPLETAVFDHASIGHGQLVFVVGGTTRDPSGSGQLTVTDVQVAVEDGALGAFTKAGSLFRESGLRAAAVAAASGRLYVIGGEGWAHVDRAPFDQATGELGEWVELEEEDLHQGAPVFAHAAIAHRGFLYVLGGIDATEAKLAEVQVAAIREDGSLGPWALTTPLPVPRAWAAVAAF